MRKGTSYFLDLQREIGQLPGENTKESEDTLLRRSDRPVPFGLELVDRVLDNLGRQAELGLPAYDLLELLVAETNRVRLKDIGSLQTSSARPAGRSEIGTHDVGRDGDRGRHGRVRGGEEGGPAFEVLVVDVLDDGTHVELGKSRDDGAVEPDLDADDLAHDLGHIGLRRIPVVDDVEDDRFDAFRLLHCARDVLDEVVRCERRREVLACESEGSRVSRCESPVGDSDSGGAEVGGVNRVLCESFCPAGEE